VVAAPLRRLARPASPSSSEAGQPPDRPVRFPSWRTGRIFFRASPAPGIRSSSLPPLLESGTAAHPALLAPPARRPVARPSSPRPGLPPRATCPADAGETARYA